VFETRDLMLEAVFAIARQIAAKSPLAIAASKKAFNHARNHGLRDALEYMGVLQGTMLEPADIGVAMRAGKSAKAGKSEGGFKNLSPLLMVHDKDRQG